MHSPTSSKLCYFYPRSTYGPCHNNKWFCRSCSQITESARAQQKPKAGRPRGSHTDSCLSVTLHIRNRPNRFRCDCKPISQSLMQLSTRFLQLSALLPKLEISSTRHPTHLAYFSSDMLRSKGVNTPRKGVIPSVSDYLLAYFTSPTAESVSQRTALDPLSELSLNVHVFCVRSAFTLGYSALGHHRLPADAIVHRS
ncbi:hypothetical protein FIBSPDRAFT_345561 [Athelia psychrophila]|uniref:Uncharacterized protein n=1 Tax=Athelia psychrophila TaxID=1759441 RepID=A0A166PUK4_9AGAM|nr:hypothetical protein FIBSPDRAFT_345561 [Fibularhizoctonia sp. CBS 109695]